MIVGKDHKERIVYTLIELTSTLKQCTEQLCDKGPSFFDIYILIKYLENMYFLFFLTADNKRNE